MTMHEPIYLKKHQRDGVYHYGKLWPRREPPLCEVLNFLNPVPRIEQREYAMETPGNRIDYAALLTDWTRIDAAEYAAAYARATSGEFVVYAGGKPLSL